MRHPSEKAKLNEMEEASKDVNLRIPTMTLSDLVSMVAIAKWVVCAHDEETDADFREAVQFMEQLIYEQSYRCGGADEIWKDPQDGIFHHPTFPEQQGDAWEAMRLFEEKILETKLIEIASRLKAEQLNATAEAREERRGVYEHMMQDVVEEKGVEGLVSALLF